MNLYLAHCRWDLNGHLAAVCEQSYSTINTSLIKQDDGDERSSETVPLTSRVDHMGFTNTLVAMAAVHC